MDFLKEEEFYGPRHLIRFKKILSLLPKEKTSFLDAAIGHGIFSFKLKKNGYNPIGIDIDLKAVFYVKKKNINSIAGDIENLPFKENSFSLILSSETLEHIEDYKKGLYEFNRILKKNGFLIVSVPLNKKFWSYWDEWAGHKRRFSYENLNEQFEPFKVVRKIFFGFPFLLLYDFLFLKNFIKKRGRDKISEKEKKFWIFLKKIFNYPLFFLFQISFPIKKLSPLLIIKLQKI